MIAKLISCSILALVMTSSGARAQYSSVKASQENHEEAKRQNLAAAREKFIGMKFWVVPNPRAIIRLTFLESDGGKPVDGSDFVLTDTTQFEVTGYAEEWIHRYVKVRFADGKEAFAPEGALFKHEPIKANLIRDVWSLGDPPRFDFTEYVLTSSPDVISAAQRKSRAKAAAASAAWKARGGVRIGMTAQQVRASNWGKPSTINRSRGSYGVHEQWVYGGNNYIYLENGVVTSIQN